MFIGLVICWVKRHFLLTTRLKKHSTSAFTEDIWREIDFIFWRELVPCLPSGVTPDGIDPVTIETTKRGVEITGTMSLLPAGSYDLALCLSRPGFSSIESVSVSKLRRAAITDSSLKGHTLMITVTDTVETPLA
jgi:hypothetical protein